MITLRSSRYIKDLPCNSSTALAAIVENQDPNGEHIDDGGIK